MNCKQVQSLLGAYLDREMTGTETLAIRDHLDACAPCRTEADDLTNLKSLLGALPDPEPAPDFEARLMQAVRAERPAVRLGLPIRTSRWRPVVGFLGVAAASMALTFGLLSSTQSRPVAKADPRGAAIEFQVARDQAFSLSDPSSGMTVFNVNDAPR